MAKKDYGFSLILGHKQDAWGVIEVHDNGRIDFFTQFSNGHKVDGDTFFSMMVISIEDKIVAALELIAGMNAAGTGGTNVRKLAGYMYVSKENADIITSKHDPVTGLNPCVKFYAGHRNKFDDDAIWEAIRTLAAAYAKSSDDKEQNKEYDDPRDGSGKMAMSSYGILVT